jgi:hypothetical protein
VLVLSLSDPHQVALSLQISLHQFLVHRIELIQNFGFSLATNPQDFAPRTAKVSSSAAQPSDNTLLIIPCPNCKSEESREGSYLKRQHLVDLCWWFSLLWPPSSSINQSHTLRGAISNLSVGSEEQFVITSSIEILKFSNETTHGTRETCSSGFETNRPTMIFIII